MKYRNASKVLPKELIIEIQKYIQGETLYIPKPEIEYEKWGILSGGRKMIDQRNAAIRSDFRNGRSIDQLAKEYFLATETIKKIVYSHKS
ncbi:CD3324 family protein [Paenibacillus pedocola]|uniref:CD3324 family protein n=1 Tax=Paenibacillus pedocola TaxID=3242193 RepID=UPI00287812BB|nr:CD3324 family protein [Paenibacillus typhae]